MIELCFLLLFFLSFILCRSIWNHHLGKWACQQVPGNLRLLQSILLATSPGDHISTTARLSREVSITATQIHNKVSNYGPRHIGPFPDSNSIVLANCSTQNHISAISLGFFHFGRHIYGKKDAFGFITLVNALQKTCFLCKAPLYISWLTWAHLLHWLPVFRSSGYYVT